jgi:Na+/phosphate symporter
MVSLASLFLSLLCTQPMVLNACEQQQQQQTHAAAHPKHMHTWYNLLGTLVLMLARLIAYESDCHWWFNIHGDMYILLPFSHLLNAGSSWLGLQQLDSNVGQQLHLLQPLC